MRDVSHQIDPNATAPVMMVDGLHFTRMRMHKQPSAIQLGHSLPPRLLQPLAQARFP